MSIFQSIFEWFCPPKRPSLSAHVQWVPGGITPTNLSIYTAVFPVRVSHIIGRVEVPNSDPATLTLVKAVDGGPIKLAKPIAASLKVSGPGLSFSNQELELVKDVNLLTLLPGDSLGVQTTGFYTKGAGGITVHMVPLK
jgi:hypothetical protein